MFFSGQSDTDQIKLTQWDMLSVVKQLFISLQSQEILCCLRDCTGKQG